MIVILTAAMVTRTESDRLNSPECYNSKYNTKRITIRWLEYECLIVCANLGLKEKFAYQILRKSGDVRMDVFYGNYISEINFKRLNMHLKEYHLVYDGKEKP
ncbi:Hypothetical predicted protein [Octopus vulgaris]|uniref:Uncharacterized protein n=1 Tax=Octopus vulgaris TaxID=6645 RepID=A0AA36FC32_OCTVU|nr:Hypothetical predicted protein [Octopus vulgaris]